MDDKNEVITKIDKVVNDFNEIWDDIKFNDLRAIKQSWDGNLSSEYVSKFDNVDKIVSNINVKLNELKSILEKNNLAAENNKDMRQ